MGRLFSKTEDEEVDDVEQEEEVDEEEDDLSDLDEETQERLARYQARQDAKWQAELTRREQAVEGAGLTFNQQGHLAISDAGKFSSYASPFARSRSEAENLQHPTSNPVTQQQEIEEDEEWVNPEYDKATFEKQLAKRIAKETNKYEQAIIGLQSTIVEDRIEQALERVGPAIEKHAPYLSEMLEHPEFYDKMREALPHFNVAQYRSAKDLAKIVGMIAPDLVETLPQRTTPKQSGQGKQADPREQMRSQINRSTLRQSAPSNSLSSGKGREYSDEEKFVSERLGIPLEEVWSLGQDSKGDEYKKYKAAVSRNGRK